MGRIYVLVITVIIILAIIDVVKSNRDTTHKILWILAILFFPLLGCIAWYLVSRNIIKI